MRFLWPKESSENEKHKIIITVVRFEINGSSKLFQLILFEFGYCTAKDCFKMVFERQEIMF